MRLPTLTTQCSSGFAAAVIASAGGPLHGLDIDTIQVNVGLACNLACHHCHVESSPKRTEQMVAHRPEVVDRARGRIAPCDQAV